MRKIKKEAVVILFFIFSLVTSINVLADEVGCCINPGAGALTCAVDRLVLKDKECCPKPETNFPDYYKSSKNPNNPTNYDNCITNFFFPNKACSDVSACALGCCCSDLGGTIMPEAQCKGTGLTFYKGETDCNRFCPTPQCNDGLDNDANGCADFEGDDLGCTSPADNDESGGSCSKEEVRCSDANYIPKLSTLEITPVKAQRKFLLRWQDECRETAVSYDILRCKESNCTNFIIIGTTNTNSFEDASGDLLFDTIYTYQIKAHYNLQMATPTITKTATLGNIECFNQFSSNNFCIHESYYNQYKNYLLTYFPSEFSNFATGVKNKFGSKFNKAFFCDTTNKLTSEGTSCPSTQICIVDNNKPSCLNKVSCNYKNANPFGLYYTLDDCETNRYCFYDRSHTAIDSCFSCDTSMACYDYKTEEACNRDNCKVGNCKWKNLANQIGIGACISKIDYNCQWCENKGTKTLENLKSFNEVFDFCTKEKSNLLSEGSFKCYFSNLKSKSCDNVVCTDYSIEQCSNEQITHDEFNKIKNPSADECGIKVCQNINNLCVKNADGDNKADCSTAICENDYFAPNTTLLPVVKKGIYDSLLIQIYDKTSVNNPVILKTSSDYVTFLCIEPCGSDGHPYNASTTSRLIILSNLNAFDGTNGNKLLSLKEGTNVIRYYSQDQSKNLEEVKKIVIEARSNTSGPKILSINITDATKVLDKYYTSNQKPTIDVQFFEPAIVTFSRLVNKKTGSIINLGGNSELNTKVSFSITQALPNDEYAFELNAKNKDNIFIDKPFSAIIVIDNSKPILNITPSDGTVIDKSLVTITLAFNKEVNIETVKINLENIKDLFSTTDNKVFKSTMNLSDGNKKLEVSASDFAKNKVISSVVFIVDANPLTISLVKPRFGTASNFVFDIVIETDNDAVCRFSLDNNFEFDFMDTFTNTSGTVHTITNFNKIPNGDISNHKLNIRCKDQRGFSFKSFGINVDATPPQLKSAFAFPNPVVEKPPTTTLTIEADEPVICKFSNISKEFDRMEGKFEDFDNYNFKTISKQIINLGNEGNYLYFVACKNKAELSSDVKEIAFKVDFTIPIAIISHTPEYFNSTNVVLAIETNKKSQCKFSETDRTVQTGEIFGASGYSHTKQLTLAVGKHTFYVICKDQFLEKFSDIVPITFTIDITPPVILSVDDSSTSSNPEFTWSTDNLRVKWNSIDNESKVSSHLYSLIETSTSNPILNWTTSYVNNEWLLVLKPNRTSLGLTNGNKYFFRVKAQNIVGLFSDTSESDGITIDTSLKPLNCTNGILDNNETDIDCGNGCDLCESNKKCKINLDCRSNFCNNGLCNAPRCDDAIKNQEESDIDCGGPCKKCQNNQACNSDNDCVSGFCNFGFCKPQESCSDSKLSSGESDIDCGGPCPTKCSEGNNCDVSEDCQEGLQCVSSTCKKCEANDKNCNGIPDEQEETAKDTDGDGMPDEWEIQNGLDPNNPNDADLDSDNDGLTNIEEYRAYKTYGKSTDPNDADTDDDGFTDKEEIDKGTSPVDPEDAPKSNFKKILMFILGISILLSGFGYLAYKVITKRKEEKFELKPRAIPRTVPQQQIKQAPLKQREEEIRIREALKEKEEQRAAERAKLFEIFKKEEKEKPKEETLEVIKKEKKQFEKAKVKKKPKISPKKPKEDVFAKLKAIAKETKKRKPKPK